jgi:hypothetical protein
MAGDSEFDGTGILDAARTAETDKIINGAASQDVEDAAETFNKEMDPNKPKDWADKITMASSAIMGIGSAVTSV